MDLNSAVPPSAHSTCFRPAILVVLLLSIAGLTTNILAQTPASPVKVTPPVEKVPILSPSALSSPSVDLVGTASLAKIPPSPARPTPQWKRLAFASGLLGTYYATQYVIERRKWWAQQTVGFHFDSSPGYARGMDKIAHFYGAEIQAMTNARLLEWSGVSHSKAALWGAILSFAGQTNVEIHDGFSPDWGFDMYDQLANGLGVGWFYAHDRIPALRRFDVRLSYWHPNAPPFNKSKDITPFTNDYSGHVYWLSMRVWDLFPEPIRAHWPRFLQLSIGVSVNDWDRYPDEDAHLSTHLSVDIDWREIIPRSSLLGRTAGDVLNRYHLPAPAIQLTPRPGISLIFVGQ